MQSADRILRCPCAGLFKAWALVGPRLYSVPLRVPRRFYVNSVLPPDNSESPAQTLGGLRVTRTLPFGREAFHIYEASARKVPGRDCQESKHAGWGLLQSACMHIWAAL